MAIGGIGTDTVSSKCQEQAESSTGRQSAFGKSVQEKQAKSDLLLCESGHQTIDIQHQAVYSRDLFVLKGGDQRWKAKPLLLEKKMGEKITKAKKKEAQEKNEADYKKMCEHKRKLYEMDLCVQGKKVKVEALIKGGEDYNLLDVDEETAKKFIFEVNRLNNDLREVVNSYMKKEDLEIITLEATREAYKRLGERYATSIDTHIKQIEKYLAELVDINNQFLELFKQCKMYVCWRRDDFSDTEELMKNECIDISKTLSAILKNHYYYYAITATLQKFAPKRDSTAKVHSVSHSIFFKSVAMLIEYVCQLSRFFPRCGGKELRRYLKEVLGQIIGEQEKRGLIYYGCLMHTIYRCNADDQTTAFYTDEHIRKTTQQSSWETRHLPRDESFRICSIRTNMAEYLTCFVCFLLGDEPVLAHSTICGLNRYFQSLLTDISDEKKARLIENVQCFIEFDLFYGSCRMFLFKLAGYRSGEDACPDADIMVYSAIALELDQFTKLFYCQSPNLQGQLQEVSEGAMVPTLVQPLFSDKENEPGQNCWYFYESLLCMESVVEEIKWLSIIDSLRGLQRILDHCHRANMADAAFLQLVEEAEKEKKQKKNVEVTKSRTAGRALSHYFRKHEEPVAQTPKKNVKSSGKKASSSSRDMTREPEFHPSLLEALSEFGKKPLYVIEELLEQVELDGTVCSIAAAKYAKVDFLLIKAETEIERLGCDDIDEKLDSFQRVLDNDSKTRDNDRMFLDCMERINRTWEELDESVHSIDDGFEQYRVYVQKYQADLQADFSCLDYFKQKLSVIKKGLVDIKELSNKCVDLYKQRGVYVRRFLDSFYGSPQIVQSQGRFTIGRQITMAFEDIQYNSEIILERGEKVACLQDCVEGMVSSKKHVFADGHQRPLNPGIDKAVSQIVRKDTKEGRLNLSTAVERLSGNFKTLTEYHSRSGCSLPVDLVEALLNFGKQYQQGSAQPQLTCPKTSWELESLFSNYVSQCIVLGHGRHQTLPHNYNQGEWLGRYNNKELFIPPQMALMEASGGTKPKWVGDKSEHFDWDMKLLSDALGSSIIIEFPSGHRRQYLPNFEEVVSVKASTGAPGVICLGYDEGQICSVKLSETSLQEVRSSSDKKSDESTTQTVPELSKAKVVTESDDTLEVTVHRELEFFIIQQLERTNEIFIGNKGLIVHGSYSRYLQGETCIYNDIDIMSVSTEVASVFINMVVEEFKKVKSNTEKNILSGLTCSFYNKNNGCSKLGLPKLWGINFFKRDSRKPIFRVQLSVYDKILTLENIAHVSCVVAGNTSNAIPCLPIHTEMTRMIEEVKKYSEKYLTDGSFIPDFDIPRTIIFSPVHGDGAGQYMKKQDNPRQVSSRAGSECQTSGEETITGLEKTRCCALIMRALMTYASGEKLLGQCAKHEGGIDTETYGEEWSKQVESLNNDLQVLRDRIITHQNYPIFMDEVNQWQEQSTIQHRKDHVAYLISRLT